MFTTIALILAMSAPPEDTRYTVTQSGPVILSMPGVASFAIPPGKIAEIAYIDGEWQLLRMRKAGRPRNQ